MSKSSLLVRKALAILPRPIRNTMIRASLEIQYELAPETTLKIAETREEFEGAFRLLHDSYVEAGFCQPQPSGIRLTLHHALPSTSVVIAKHRGRVVGTLTLVRDSRAKLPMEKHWDLSFLRTHGARITEATCLAIHPDFRRVRNGNILFPLYKFLYEYSTHHFGTDFLGAVIHPKDLDFHQAVFLYERADSRIIPDYYGAPAVGLYLDLRTAPENYQEVYRGKRAGQNLYRYFFEHSLQFQFPQRPKLYSVDDPMMNRELLEHFFVRCNGLAAQMTQAQAEVLASHFPGDTNGRSCRFAVELPAAVTESESGRMWTGVIKDVSRTGLRLIVPDLAGLQKDSSIQIEFQDHEGRRMTVSAHLAWFSEQHGAGFRLDPSQSGWDTFIGALAAGLPDATMVRRTFKPAA